MSEKRKIQRFNLDEGRIWEAIEGLSPYKTTYTLEEVCEKLNEQQATIEELKEENSNLNSILNEVGLQKPFIKILDDYMIEYDGSCFSMHKPSDIRSFVYLMNRNNNFDELQCGYNDESMVIDDE